MKIEENKSLKQYNTFGIDVSARYFVTLSDLCDFDELKSLQLDRHRGLFVLGGGSNIVFTKDYDGVVLHPENSEIKATDGLDGDVHVEAGAGMKWVDFVRLCVQNEWHGVENMAYIPGTVGAAPVQNVGAYGVEAKDVISAVNYLDIETGEHRSLDAEQCRFAYRDSVFKHALKGKCIVTSVVFKLNKNYTPVLTYKALVQCLAERGIDKPTACQTVEAVTALRKAKLPEVDVTGSAGSFFKNPVVSNDIFERLLERHPDIVSFPVDGGRKIAAGWLIERAGWKGKTVGNVGVYEKQALVLVNRGGCSGREVMGLANAIIDDIDGKFGIRLEPEAIIM